ncbi:helicase-related protein [Acidithrix sp. C25]|uniref:helicase-related protein n=1 Tax=Acidithrix sp. C25 TaxID=1671482 RepID=UPI00191BC7CA|nr:helicase-related protein [Acidithrix sp. C25]
MSKLDLLSSLEKGAAIYFSNVLSAGNIAAELRSKQTYISLVATDRQTSEFESGNTYFDDSSLFSSLSPGEIPDGVYVLYEDVSVSLLVVDFSNGGVEDANGKPLDGDQIDKVRTYFETAMQDGKSIPSKPKYDIDDGVQRRGSGDLLKVVDRSWRAEDNCWQYRCRSTTGASNRFLEDELEDIPEDTNDVRSWLRQNPMHNIDTAAALTFIKIDQVLSDLFYSAFSSLTTFIPYQFLPVLKFLIGDSQRILIADEVGLGKTIEAGLIWRELDQRGSAKNVLVVCPSNLVAKWKAEMRNRFGYILRDLNDEELKSLYLRSPGRLAASHYFVVSLEKIRSGRFSDQIVELLDEQSDLFDLVILDEAHNIRNSETKGFRTIKALLDDVESVVFLSATPINNDSKDLHNLMRLLRPDAYEESSVFGRILDFVKMVNEFVKFVESSEFERDEARAKLVEISETEVGAAAAKSGDFKRIEQILAQGVISPEDEVRLRHSIVSLSPLASEISRMRRREVTENPVVRDVKILEVEWNEREKQIYDEYIRLLKRSCVVLGRRYGYVAQMPLRFAASCMPAFVEAATKKWEPFYAQSYKSQDSDAVSVEDALSIDDQFEEDDRSDDEKKDAPKMAGQEEIKLLRDESFMEHLDNFMSYASSLQATDSKYEKFKEWILEFSAKDDKQLIIFSFFTGTLKYLQKRLADDFDVRLLYGKTAPEARQKIMDDFRKGTFKILLMSEVGSEGLDFEFCTAMVNYDVPWNPMKIEQRIGRLDRFGQKSEKIHIFNMSVKDTIDNNIYMRLFDRLGVFQSYVGGHEEILGHIAFTNEDISEMWSPDISPEDSEARIAQFEKARLTNFEAMKATESAEALVNTDRLLVKGFEADQKRRGNYLGPNEIRIFVETFLRRVRNSPLRPNRRPGIYSVRLDDDARSYVSRFQRSNRQFDTAVKSDSEVIISFDAQRAIENGYDHVDLTHPLVQGARVCFRNMEAISGRYGRIRIPYDQYKGSYLVKVCLAKSPNSEFSKLVAFAVRADNYEYVPEVGMRLMAALADGAFEKSSEGEAIAYSDLIFEKLEDMEMDWRRSEEAEEQAKLDSRRAAELSRKRIVLSSKIEQLEKSILNSSNETYIKGQRTKISNRKSELAQLDGVESKRDWISIEILPKLVIDLEVS